MLAHLKSLGTHVPYDKYESPSVDMLEVFDNPRPGRNYLTTFVFNEFTSCCPKTGQPDFGIIRIEYIADKHCIETKSLKIYLGAYRMQGAFMEAVTNQILDDLVEACDPIVMAVRADFNTRGGTDISVMAEYTREG